MNINVKTKHNYTTSRGQVVFHRSRLNIKFDEVHNIHPSQ